MTPPLPIQARVKALRQNVARALLRIGPLRRFWHVIERCPPFFAAAFSERGLGSAAGRTLILGKFRRVFLSAIPPLARALKKKYGLEGGCTSCGASCNLLFRCPHWDAKSHLCTVYQDRPNICRYFPITPADIADRNLVKPDHPCGFTFTKPKG